MKRISLVVCMLFVLVLAFGCKGNNGDQGTAGPAGADGSSLSASTTILPTGSDQCANGGYLLTVTSSDPDVASIQVPICNGEATLTTVGPDDCGRCENGGWKIESGLDTNGNGILDPSEVSGDPIFVCNGVQGDQGPKGDKGDTPVPSSFCKIVSHGCLTRDAKITTYFWDVDGDGFLDNGELPIAIVTECINPS